MSVIARLALEIPGEVAWCNYPQCTAVNFLISGISLCIPLPSCNANLPRASRTWQLARVEKVEVRVIHLNAKS